MGNAEVMVDESNKSVEPVETPAVETPAAVEPKPVSKMSKEELDTFLNGEPVDNSTDVVDKVEEDDEPAKVETPPKEEDEITDDPDKSDTVTRKELEALMAENKKLLKKAENQDKFFDRVGTEVGLLRKMTPEEDKVELDRIRDIYIDDPIAGQEEYAKYKKGQESATTVSREIETNKRIESNQTGFETLVPDFETNRGENIEGMVALMTEDGAPAASIEAFKEQPYLMDNATLYNLHLRNVAGKTIKEQDAKITELETQIEELKKRPDELLSNIQNASRNNTLTGKSAGAVPANSATVAKPISKMSKEELDKMLGR